MTPPHYLLSGCSGGGKSTLLQALIESGIAGVTEPGRRIVANSLGPKPWDDPVGFARAAIELALCDLQRARGGALVFDRGLGDALAAFERATGQAHPAAQGLERRFAQPVFMAPPWPEIYQQDKARRHGFEDAVAEYEYLCGFYPRYGYQVVPLPKVPVADRVAFVRARIAP